MFLVLVLLFSLNSCNTLIGMWRDTAHAYRWTRDKVQGSGSGDDLAPVY
jgi:hypothetical protein